MDAYIKTASSSSQTVKDKDFKPDRYVHVRELIKETKDSNEIRSQLLNVFLPAHDAAGVALTNVFSHLARHSTVYSKLRHEILGIDEGEGNVELNFERIKSLKYLQYVIQETLRLNPVIGTNTRMALKDTILPSGGRDSGYGTSPIFVRIGDIITFSFYALHKRKNLFGDDASIFRPERWEEMRPAHWSFVPFGGGPRVCPGQQLSLTEIGYCIIRIL